MLLCKELQELLSSNILLEICVNRTLALLQNRRVQVLDYDLQFQRHINNEGLEGRSCTGIDISQQGLVVVNWRTRKITEMTSLGDTIRSFSHNTFQVGERPFNGT